MADKKKQLVFNFIDFLKSSQQDGTVKEDDKESLDVAIQCLSEVFELDPDSSDDSRQYSIKPASLLSIFEVALKTLNAKKTPSTAAPAAAASQESASTASTSAPSGDHEPSADDVKKAEALKMEGNALISKKSYSLAIQKYNEAIALNPTNSVYYSNRAAAYSAEGNHEKAVEDATESLRRDPKFARGYSRLGHAQYSLGNYTEAVEAYTKGLELDSDNANMKASLAQAKSKAQEQGSSSDREAGDDSALDNPAAGAGAGAGGMPDLSALAGMFGGGGGGAGAGGAGGMPDLASLMQNPMMMQMAQQMMSNGGLERLMSNPSLRNMANQMQSGGGMPDLESLRNDPAMRDLAQQFMGGGGAGGR